MTLLEFLQSETDIKNAIHIEECDGQTVIYVDTVEVRDAEGKRDFHHSDYFVAILERFLPEHFGTYGQFEYYLDEDAIQTLRTIQISVDEEVRNYRSYAKYPYYKAAGRSITPAEKERIRSVCRSSGYACDLHGLFSEDGHINELSNTDRYPNTGELLRAILDFLIAVPELNVQIIFSEFYEPTRPEDFFKWISLGIEVQNQTIKILNSKNAKQRYLEIFGSLDEVR